ncbi:MAG: ankyrin repeat domain-containing protein [Proteobacteria bacterium]|nr:ankyrin repeat domain-containing protein [Pseudomonadota bacterium]MBU1742739.1 ankyrin repeat domain-containing protein [Pseudomonadota bacterium]
MRRHFAVGLSLLLALLMWGCDYDAGPWTDAERGARLPETIFVAVKSGDFQGVQSFVEAKGSRGYSVGTLGYKYRATPLHWAAWQGRVAVVDLLLGRRAKVNARDIVGQTPLHYAAWRGNTAAAARLLKGGADPNARDKFGLTPYRLALMASKLETMKVLAGAGGKM